MEFDNDRIIKPTLKVEIAGWILLWLAYPLINWWSVLYGDMNRQPTPPMVFIFDLLHLLFISVLVFPAYVVYGRLMVSKFLFQKRYFFFTVLSLGWFMVIHAFLFLLYSIMLKFDVTPLEYTYFSHSYSTITRESFWIIINMILAGVICFIRETLAKDDQVATLKKDNNFYKLRYLRSQLNPHFLFNTLNSIYSLSLQKSDKAPEMVVRLADIMRYLIYECNEEKISLNKEIEFIRNYIEIEKMRFKADVRFTVDGETEGIMIEPFLFISFIENGFKHALDNSFTEPFIYINMKVLPHQIVLNVINSSNADLESQAKKIHGKGISQSKSLLELLYPKSYALDIIQTDKDENRENNLRIHNAKERLEILYPDSYTLDVILKNNTFTVSLIVKTKAA
ncbi:MAG: histidine kinase [Bacteroidota bacterium]